MTWSAVATGGMATLQYKFYRLRQGVGWTLAQDYGPSNAYTWTPTAGEEGTYLFQVWVRSAGSSAAYEAWKNGASFQVIP